MHKKIAVAMSGGVDSTAAAIILKEKGYDIFGITLQMVSHQHPATRISNYQSHINYSEVKRKCSKISISHYLFNAEKIFAEKVIEDFCQKYLNGKTPNPCIRCNKIIKWGVLWNHALELGATNLATGHYAGVERDNNTKRFLLKKGKDKKKDQSYFLWNLNQFQLSRTLFPLYEYNKNDITNKLNEYGLDFEKRQESQEICFIPDDDYKKFLTDRFKNQIKSGNILDEQGNILGRHKGFPFYTIGQRKGLGLIYPHPLYVKEIRSKTNEIVVARKENLYKNSLIANNCNWIFFEKLESKFYAKAKIRFKTQESPCKVTPINDKIRVDFEIPQLSITPGQSVVFYQRDYLIGGGIILKEL